MSKCGRKVEMEILITTALNLYLFFVIDLFFTELKLLPDSIATY